MPLDASVDKIRVRGRTQTSTTGAADIPPTLFPTVPQLLNKASHSRIRLDRVNPASNSTQLVAAQPYAWDPNTGSWWADVIAVDDADVLASGQTQWGQWGVDDSSIAQRYYIEPKLVGSATFFGDPVTGAPLAQGSGGIRTVWLDDLVALYAAVSTPGVGGGGGLDAEGAQDAVAAMIAAGTHSGITFVYDDAGNRISATVTVTGDLPEASANAAGAPVTAADLLGRTTRFTGTVAQPAPPALPGRVFAVGVQTTGLTLSRDGTDVFVDDAGNTATSFTPPTVGVRTLHCTIAGQWRTTTSHVSVGVLDLRHGAILNTHLLAWAYAQAFRVVSATRDANSAITTASVVWPDGSTGTFTTTTASSAFPGAIDAYTVTYVPTSGTSKTVTQPAVTRDAAGAVTAQPALTVA